MAVRQLLLKTLKGHNLRLIINFSVHRLPSQEPKINIAPYSLYFSRTRAVLFSRSI